MRRFKKVLGFLSAVLFCLLVFGVLFDNRIPDVEFRFGATQKPDRNRIVLSNISNLYLDVHKAATFYSGDDILVITFLTQTRVKQTNVYLIVRRDGTVVFKKPVDIYEFVPCSTPSYVFSVVKKSLRQFVCSSSSLCQNPLSPSSRLTYQLVVNDLVMTDEFRVNLVNTSLNTRSKLTARLIKCMWMLPQNSAHFELVLRLIIESKYDSIYICVFARDYGLKVLLEKYKSELADKGVAINVIELENIPHFEPGRPDLLDYSHVLDDSSIADNFGVLDPVMEYLLNQVYPFLVEKYRYVQAADFDHILFTRNLTFYDRVHGIVQKVGIRPPHASIYLNQYWALDNPIAFRIFDSIKASIESDATLVERLRSNQSDMLEKFVNVEAESFRFRLRVYGRHDWAHVHKLLDVIEANRTSWEKGENRLRHMMFLFAQPNVFGQTIHNTKSTLVVKLCGAGDFFSRGRQFKLYSNHFVHYRDTFNLDLLRVDSYSRVLSPRLFVLWKDFDKNEL